MLFLVIAATAAVAGAARDPSKTASAAPQQTAALPRVLVTGATGRLGALIYAQAKADDRIGAVSALLGAGATL